MKKRARISKRAMQFKMQELIKLLKDQNRQDMVDHIQNLCIVLHIDLEKDIYPLQEGDDMEWEVTEVEEDPEMDMGEKIARSLAKMLGGDAEIMQVPGGVMARVSLGNPGDDDPDETDLDAKREPVDFEKMDSLCKTLTITGSKYTPGEEPSFHLRKEMFNTVRSLMYTWQCHTVGDVMEMTAYIQKHIDEYVFIYTGPSFVQSQSMKEVEFLEFEMYANRNSSVPFYKTKVGIAA